MIHQVILDGIGDNMDSLFHCGNYGAMKKIDTSTIVYYLIKCVSEAYTLQYDTTRYV